MFGVVQARDAEWNESKHPRGQPGNAGQFRSGGNKSEATGIGKSKPKTLNINIGGQLYTIETAAGRPISVTEHVNVGGGREREAKVLWRKGQEAKSSYYENAISYARREHPDEFAAPELPEATAQSLRDMTPGDLTELKRQGHEYVEHLWATRDYDIEKSRRVSELLTLVKAEEERREQEKTEAAINERRSQPVGEASEVVTAPTEWGTLAAGTEPLWYTLPHGVQNLVDAARKGGFSDRSISQVFGALRAQGHHGHAEAGEESELQRIASGDRGPAELSLLRAIGEHQARKPEVTETTYYRKGTFGGDKQVISTTRSSAGALMPLDAPGKFANIGWDEKRSGQQLLSAGYLPFGETYTQGYPEEKETLWIKFRDSGDDAHDMKIATDPPVSEAQRRAMFAAAAGHSQIGIPQSVGKEFADADKGGHLPAKAKDMEPSKWAKLKELISQWLSEEAAEPEHAAVDEVKHDPKNGQFTSGSGSSGGQSLKQIAGLSDGVTLNDNSNPNFPDEPEFHFHDKNGKMIGSLSLYTYPEYGKTINSIHIFDDNFRGKGLGTQAIKALAEKYGSISSDPQANTSQDAVKMWQRLGAVRVPTSKNTKGYFYQLASKSGLAHDEARVPMSAVEEPSRMRAAGVAFVTPTGDCLFVRRSGVGDHAGEWALPGGRIEDGETHEQAARREAKEETGYDCGDGDCLKPAHDHTFDGVGFATYYHPVADRFEPRLNDEHTEYKWAPIDAPPAPLHPGVRKTIGDILDGLGKDDMFSSGPLGFVGKISSALAGSSSSPPPSSPPPSSSSDMSTSPNAGLPAAASRERETHDADPVDTATVDIPLLIRLMEYAREDAPDDEALHSATERLIALSKAEDRPLKMEDYERIVMDAALDPTGKLSETTREDIDSQEHRKDMPADAFLGPNRIYPVKEQRDGEWKYTRALLLAAARRARMQGRADIARRADAIRTREFGEGEGEGEDAETAHDPKTGQFTSRSTGQKISGKHASQMNRQERENLSRNSLTTTTGKGLYHHPQHGYFRIDEAKDAGLPSGRLRITHQDDPNGSFGWAIGGKVGTGPGAYRMSRAVKSGNERLQSMTGDAALALDRALASDKRTYDNDGRLHVDSAAITKVGVFPYLGKEVNAVMRDEPGWEMLEPEKRYYLLRPADEIEKAASTFCGLPILWTHRPASAKDHPHEITIGATGNDCAFDYPYLKCSLSIWPAYATEAIEDGSQRQLSAGYAYKAVPRSGEFEGQRYDFVMTDLVGNHIALVRDGRSGADCGIDWSIEEQQWRAIEKALIQLRG